MPTPDDSIAHCCFCFNAVDVSAEGDGLTLGITRQDSEAYQELYAHGSCMAAHLLPRVPLLADAWDENRQT